MTVNEAWSFLSLAAAGMAKELLSKREKSGVPVADIDIGAGGVEETLAVLDRAGIPIHKYGDPVDGGERNITLDRALEVVDPMRRGDPSLVYVDAASMAGLAEAAESTIDPCRACGHKKLNAADPSSTLCGACGEPAQAPSEATIAEAVGGACDTENEYVVVDVAWATLIVSVDHDEIIVSLCAGPPDEDGVHAVAQESMSSLWELVEYVDAARGALATACRIGDGTLGVDIEITIGMAMKDLGLITIGEGDQPAFSVTDAAFEAQA